MTLCFSSSQALLAAKAGAEYVSPFIGRLDDINLKGIDLISDIKLIYSNYKFSTKILAASIRTINHVKHAALTLPATPVQLHKASFNIVQNINVSLAFMKDGKKGGRKEEGKVGMKYPGRAQMNKVSTCDDARFNLQHFNYFLDHCLGYRR